MATIPMPTSRMYSPVCPPRRTTSSPSCCHIIGILLAPINPPKKLTSIKVGLPAPYRSLIEHFENSVKSGKVFKTGETIDIGWGRLKLLENETGDLVVHEPSFFDMPIKWVAGASRSYSHLMLQRQVCLELDVVPDFASLMQAGVIFEFMMVNRGDFRMDRHDGDGKGNSGWALYELGKIDAERVQWVSLFQISVMYSQIIPFWGLYIILCKRTIGRKLSPCPE